MARDSRNAIREDAAGALQAEAQFLLDYAQQLLDAVARRSWRSVKSAEANIAYEVRQIENIIEREMP